MDVFQKNGRPELFGQVCLVLRSRDGDVSVSEIAPKTLDHLCVVDGERGQRVPQIEEVAPLLALVQGAQLGGEQLLEPVGGDIGRTGKPRILNGEFCRLST